MQKQNFQNHRKLMPESASHKIYYISIICINLIALANLSRALMTNSGRTSALLFMLIGIALLSGYFLFHSFSIKAQDRAIRAEENLRHFVLTGKLLGKELKIKQIVGLRFAPDEEFVGLADRAIKENLTNNEIKMSIINWKEDNHRA